MQRVPLWPIACAARQMRLLNASTPWRSVLPWCCIWPLACLGTVSAQKLSLGIAGGGAPTDAFESTTSPPFRFYSPSADYLVGATLEYRLPRGFSVETDGLFRELHLTDAAGTAYISREHVVTWEFPVLAKYRFRGPKFAPFVEAGPAFRTTGNLNEANPSHAGIAPTVRYTRWTSDNNFLSGPESKPDQLEVLLGISSRPQSLGNPLGGRFALGAIAGVTLTHDLSSGSLILQSPPRPGVLSSTEETIYDSGADSFLAGPALEMALNQRFYIEADAVYHAIRYISKVVLDDGMTLGPHSGADASTWEFPVLAKFKFGSGHFKPFAEAGASFRLPVEGIFPAGFSVGGGVEIRWRALKIAPAVRSTRWGHTNSFEFGDQQLQPNQVEFLMGFLL
jgi:hypothetical protein